MSEGSYGANDGVSYGTLDDYATRSDASDKTLAALHELLRADVTEAYDFVRWAARNTDAPHWDAPSPTSLTRAASVLADEVARLADELTRIRTDYHAQLEAVHDLTETLAEERVQHAVQVERLRADLAVTVVHLAEWMTALGAVVPELEREMAPEPRHSANCLNRPRLVP